MKIVKLLLILGLVLVDAWPHEVAARSKKLKAKEPEVHETKIGSVNGNTINIAEDKVTRTFSVTQFTEINVNGQRASLADLHPGMLISFTIAGDPTKLSRIDARETLAAPARRAH